MCYHSGLECTWEQWQWRGTSHSPNLQGWSLTIRWFNTISRTLVGGVLPLCRDTVGVFYSPHPDYWASTVLGDGKFWIQTSWTLHKIDRDGVVVKYILAEWREPKFRDEQNCLKSFGGKLRFFKHEIFLLTTREYHFMLSVFLRPV